MTKAKAWMLAIEAWDASKFYPSKIAARVVKMPYRVYCKAIRVVANRTQNGHECAEAYAEESRSLWKVKRKKKLTDADLRRDFYKYTISWR